MPSRVADAILKKEMNLAGKARMRNWRGRTGRFREIDNFPYLYIETDGNAFPQMTEASLDAFVLQARRVHAILQKSASAGLRRKGTRFISTIKQQPVQIQNFSD